MGVRVSVESAAREGNVLRLYWMPLLLWLDECCAERFIEQLNRKASASA